MGGRAAKRRWPHVRVVLFTSSRRLIFDFLFSVPQLFFFLLVWVVVVISNADLKKLPLTVIEETAFAPACMAVGGVR